MNSVKPTHIDARGTARMVDVSDKDRVTRMALAEGWIVMRASTLSLILEGNNKKGDIFSVARLAGIMAAKKTHDLIPLCHPLLLGKIDVILTPDEKRNAIHVTATAKLRGQTGVEMEALTAVSIACLTIYDMVKAVDPGMSIDNIRLLEKSGGQSGMWQRFDHENGATREDELPT